MSARTPLLWLIPGNPGDAYYYRDFAAHLRARGHEVVVFDHARFGRPQPSLLPYAHHQVAQLREHLQHSGRDLRDVELIGVGHSIGGYIVHLIDTHALLPLAHGVLLFPFVARPAWDARLLLAATRAVGADSARLLSFVPTGLRTAAISAAGLGAHEDHIQRAITGPHAPSYPAMAITERREVARHAHAGYLRHSPLSQRGRLTLIHAARDRWSPVNEHADLAAISRVLDGDVSHAFVLQPQTYATVATAIEDALRSR